MLELPSIAKDKDSMVNEVDDVKNACISRGEASGSESVNVKEGKLAKTIPEKTDQKTKTYDNAAEKERIISALTAFVGDDVEAHWAYKMIYVTAESELGMVNENKLATKEEPARVTCEVNQNLVKVVGDAVRLAVEQHTTVKKVVSETEISGTTGNETFDKVAAINQPPAGIVAKSSQTKMKAANMSLALSSAETKSGQTSVTEDKPLITRSYGDAISSEKSQGTTNINLVSSKVQEDLVHTESEQKSLENALDIAIAGDPHYGKEKQSDFSRDHEEGRLTKAVPGAPEAVPSIEVKLSETKNIGNVINVSTSDRWNCDGSNRKNLSGERDLVPAHKQEERVNEPQPNMKSSREKSANLTAKVSSSRRVIAKPRGKPEGKVGSRTYRSRIATPSAFLATSSGHNHLTKPKVSSARRVIRKMGRPWSTGTSKRKTEKNRRQKHRKVEERKRDLQHLQASNSDLRRRVMNVKSKLFSETKSFRAYKSARQEEQLRRKKKTKTRLSFDSTSFIDFRKRRERQ